MSKISKLVKALALRLLKNGQHEVVVYGKLKENNVARITRGPDSGPHFMISDSVNMSDAVLVSLVELGDYVPYAEFYELFSDALIHTTVEGKSDPVDMVDAKGLMEVDLNILLTLVGNKYGDMEVVNLGGVNDGSILLDFPGVNPAALIGCLLGAYERTPHDATCATTLYSMTDDPGHARDILVNLLFVSLELVEKIPHRTYRRWETVGDVYEFICFELSEKGKSPKPVTSVETSGSKIVPDKCIELPEILKGLLPREGESFGTKPREAREPIE